MSGLGELDRPGTPRDPGPREGAGGEDAGRAGRDGRQSPPASAVRRSAADPVKGLLHRHRELCERAVDPLEIVAGLEAHGVTDRTAARFRHRDVFSLAEEMYARVPRDGDAPAPPRTGRRPGRADPAPPGPSSSPCCPACCARPPWPDCA